MVWKYNHSSEFIQLIRRFPLAPISSRAQHTEAMSMLSELAQKTKLSTAESDYFDVLSSLVSNYERDAVSPAAATPQAVLRFLMEQNGLKSSDISRITDVHRAHISDFFAERRNLPRHAAAKLGAYFKADSAIFLPRIDASGAKKYKQSNVAAMAVSERTGQYKVAATKSKGAAKSTAATSAKKKASRTR